MTFGSGAAALNVWPFNRPRPIFYFIGFFIEKKDYFSYEKYQLILKKIPVEGSSGNAT